ncbi:MAG: DUF5317 domain-containing protein [Actinomycetota bacterium]
MLTFILVGIAAALIALARGGSLDSLAATRLRLIPLVVIGLAVEIVFEVWRPEWLSEGAALAILVLSDVLVLWFVLANRRTPGILLVGAGLALNALVIALNGGMPVSDRAVQVSGAPTVEGDRLKHERLSSDTNLPWLGDVIPVPVLGEVLSIGDLVLALGIAQLVHGRTLAGRNGPRGGKVSDESRHA